MKKLLISLVGIYFTVTSVQAQPSVISGTVTDAKTGEPLPGVSVYLSETTVGIQTDAEGNYRFETSYRGVFTLATSHVGYKPLTFSIDLKPGSRITKDFKLTERLFELNEVEVVTSNREWQINYRFFRDFFIGSHLFAGDVYFRNPEVLDLQKNGEEIIVKTDQPLIYENAALGYIAEAEIVEMRFYPDDNSGIFKVLTSFTEMETDSRQKRREWRRNRTRVYEGSPLHFFRSLIQDRVREEGFTIYHLGGDIRKSDRPELMTIYYPNSWHELQKNYLVYELTKEPVMVGYKLRFDQFRNLENEEELTEMIYATNRRFFLVNKLGVVFDPAYLKFTGKWGTERTTLFLPLGYELEFE